METKSTIPLTPQPSSPLGENLTTTAPKNLSPLGNLSRPIPSDLQLLEPGLVLNHQALLVRQMQEADETVARGNIGHRLLGVYRLQAVHHGGEVQ